MNGYSPYELVFGHKMTLFHELEIKVDTVVSGTYKDNYEKLKKNIWERDCRNLEVRDLT